MSDEQDFPSGIPREVCALFETLAFEIKDRGFDHYSADAILHRIRWHYHIEQGYREFKCNDHWTATLARWFLSRHSDMEGFFELRVLRRLDEQPTRILTDEDGQCALDF